MSRIWSILAAFASAFCRKEIDAAKPYVEKAIDAIPDAIKASKPLVAFTGAAHQAMTDMSNDSAVVPSLTGVLGALATAALNDALAPSFERKPQTHE